MEIFIGFILFLDLFSLPVEEYNILFGLLFGFGGDTTDTTATEETGGTTGLDPASAEYLADQRRRAQAGQNQLAGNAPPPGAHPTAQQAIDQYGNPIQVGRIDGVQEVSSNLNLQHLQGVQNLQQVGAGGGNFQLGQYGGNFNVNQQTPIDGQFDPGQLQGSRVQDLMNPYQQEVIGGVQRDFDRQRDLASTRAGQQATSAGAFGGSRSAILEGEQLNAINAQESQALGQLRSGGYESSRNAALQEFLGGQSSRAGVAGQRIGAQASLGSSRIGAEANLKGTQARQFTAQQGLGLQAHESGAGRRLQADQYNAQNQISQGAQNLQAGQFNNQNQIAAGAQDLQAQQHNSQLDFNTQQSNISTSLSQAGLNQQQTAGLLAAGTQQFGADLQAKQQWINSVIASIQAGTAAIGPTGTVTSNTSSGTSTTQGP